MNTVTERNHAEENAQEHLKSIIAMVTALDRGDKIDGQDAPDAIQESILGAEVRTDWHAPGDSDNKPSEYLILLSTGGPACRIIGDLDSYCLPTSAKLEYQDWGTPWTRYYNNMTDEDDEKLLLYASQFYFGE